MTGNFLADIERLLARHGLPPDAIELELTETMLQTGAVTVEALHGLRMLNVDTALDDFGTGFSSLTSIEQLPLSRVKLDRSVIAEVDSNPRSAAIVHSMIGLCRNLGLQVTIEGVERLIETLKKQIAADGHGDEDRQAWLLLFELYQWLSRETEYEDLAIEYAVTFEISPPAWEAVKTPLAVIQAKPQPAPGQETAGDETFALNGVISESSQARLNELINYAADKQEVRINMAGVTRVDFVAVGNFMGALINLTQAGKKVLILEANEMVQALFHMMSIQEFATLIRKKSR